jgi:L-cysteine desulfidase
MNVYKEVTSNEVFAAMGCTEPISLAYCASLAAEGFEEPPREISFFVDQATYKNGLAVTIPNTGGEKGNLIAGILGALIARPALQMQILSDVSAAQLALAKKLSQDKCVHFTIHPDSTDFYVETQIRTESHEGICIITGSHTNVTYRERDGLAILDRRDEAIRTRGPAYKEMLKGLKVADLIEIAEDIDDEDMEYLRRGIDMNLRIAREGMKLKKVGYYLLDLKEKGMFVEDVFSSTKILTACAVDARMDGMAMPVMSSGGSGNQGIVASLVPYNVGKHFAIGEDRILRSIALSHLLNSYIKAYIGELAPICGCAIAAGVGAASAIVYQQKGKDLMSITMAINNLVSDIGGMICDGAKSGCALKVVSSTDAAIRAAYLGIHNYGILGSEGFVGTTAEATIQNLSRISHRGMEKMDDTIVKIMLKKSRYALKDSL